MPLPYVALRRPVVCVIYPQSSVHALRAHVVRRSVPGAKPPLSSRPVALCGGMLCVRVRREQEIVISRWVYRQTYM